MSHKKGGDDDDGDDRSQHSNASLRAKHTSVYDGQTISPNERNDDAYADGSGMTDSRQNTPAPRFSRPAESLSYEGRSWMKKEYNFTSTFIRDASLDVKRKIRFMSYNVLAQYKCANIRYSANILWEQRMENFLTEIATYDPDIICFQDVDYFKAFWRVRLMVLGYDSVFKQKTQRKDEYQEGVVISYKRDYYQLFKSVEIDLNESAELGASQGSVFQEHCRSDDVGLLLFLQPWQKGSLQTAICVASVMLADNPAHTNVRGIQAQYFCRQVEMANRDFQVPVIVGAALYDSPLSPAYAVLRTGRSPLTGNPPPRPGQPNCHPTCRGSLKVKWMPPKLTPADPPVSTYRISWRPGGSLTLGFRASKDFSTNDCIQYEARADKMGNVRTIVLDDLAVLITGLTSDMPYEFRIAAINDEGMGVWSIPSDPICLPNPDNAPPMPAKQYMRSLPEVLQLREALIMDRNDLNVQRCLSDDPIRSLTNLTPRTIDGKRDMQVPRGSVLPYNVNPKEGWQASLEGGRPEALTALLSKDYIVRKSILRTKEGFSEKVSDTLSAKISYYPNADQIVADKVETLMLNQKEAFEEMQAKLLKRQKAEDKARKLEENPDFVEDEEEVPHNFIEKPKFRLAPAERKNTDSGNRISLNWNDDVVLDAKEIVRGVGKPNKRQIHDLRLRSALEDVAPAGEPLFTTCQPTDPTVSDSYSKVECQDYIFYTGNSFLVSSFLTIPAINTLEGQNPVEPLYILDTYFTSTFNYAACSFNPMHYNKILGISGGTIMKSEASKASTAGGGGDGDKKEQDKEQKGEKKGEKATAAKDLPLSKNPFDDGRNGRGPPQKAAVQAVRKQLMHTLDESNVAVPRYLTFDPKVPSSSVFSPLENGSAIPAFFGGTWGSFPAKNLYKNHLWLPNDKYSSSHLAVGADLCYLDASLAAEWQ